MHHRNGRYHDTIGIVRTEVDLECGTGTDIGSIIN
jgi:molybdopterin-binding protein